MHIVITFKIDYISVQYICNCHKHIENGECARVIDVYVCTKRECACPSLFTVCGYMHEKQVHQIISKSETTCVRSDINRIKQYFYIVHRNKMDSVLNTIAHPATGHFFQALPLTLGSGLKVTATALSKNAETFYLRKDNVKPGRTINVYDNRGNIRYTINRDRRARSKWYIYEQPSNIEVARIDAGFFGRTVAVKGKGRLRMVVGPGLLGKLHRHYYDSEGNLYEWSRRSNYLERISNPGGGYEESRERVALTRVLRPKKFDWELIVDTNKVDLVSTLGTSFIMMKTQWLDNKASQAPSTSGISGDHSQQQNTQNSAYNLDEWDDLENTSDDGLLMYKSSGQPLEPRDFFNPPRGNRNRKVKTTI